MCIMFIYIGDQDYDSHSVILSHNRDEVRDEGGVIMPKYYPILNPSTYK